MKLNKISLQIKIIVLTALLILIPMFVANYIFISHSELFNSRFIYVGVDNIDGFLDNVDSESEIEESEVEEDLKDNNSNEAKADDEDEDEMVEGEQKSNKAKADDKDESDEGEQKSNKAKADDKEESDEGEQESNKVKVIIPQKYKLLEDFLNDNRNRIKKHDGYLVSLNRYKSFYLVGSILYIIIAVFFLWVFLSHSVGPFKQISSNLKSFQNEKEEVSNDIVECALKFDNFLTTAKTLLQESYSITLEINRKLEPLTVMSVFSDDNVKQFFTDVQEISRSSNYIANTLDSTTAHIQDVSASAQTIADRSHEAATDSAETAAIAGEGKNAVSETIDTMESIKDEVLGLEDVIENLNSASMQIGEIVNTITNIAYQTNLLALNAAIEAARAGEHGQGFSVVADEVKKLAEESGEAAEDISKKIKEMLKKTGKAVETINRGATKVIEGVNIANIAGNNLDKIVASVSNVNKMIQDISNASSEQSQNIDSLRGSIESITGATKITSEGTKRVATAVNEQLSHIKQYISVTKELLTLVQMMGDMLDKFNLN